MCYSADASPPYPGFHVGGGAPEIGDLVLTSADGTRFGAYFAMASAPTGVGMVILPDVRGLHDFYKELAQRFAEIGIDAIAFDYFGRTAGIGARGEEFAYREHVEKLDWSLVDEDAKVAAEYLRSPAGGEVRSIFTVGFCFGGAMSWRQSAAGYGIDGAIGFYGQPARTRSVMADMKAPLLLLVAGADFTPLEEFEKFSGELTEAGVVHRMKVYEGAPHSFFDRTFAEHAEACQDAWAQILEFVRANKTE